MRLIDKWKEAYKLHSVQLALLFAAWQWWEVFSTGAMPQGVTEWINAIVGLLIVIVRVLSQDITDKKV